jgi:hypothetical protein
MQKAGDSSMDVELDADSALPLVELLRQMQLVGPTEAPSLAPPAGGVSSEIVRVDTERGAFCLMRFLPKCVWRPDATSSFLARFGEVNDACSSGGEMGRRRPPRRARSETAIGLRACAGRCEVSSGLSQKLEMVARGCGALQNASSSEPPGRSASSEAAAARHTHENGHQENYRAPHLGFARQANSRSGR